MAEHDTASHQLSSGAKLALGVTAGAAAITLLPYLWPGGASLRTEVITGLHGTGMGTGLAGGINSVLSAVPGIGDSLAAGGVAALAGTAFFGIGGMFLSRWLEKREQHTPGSFPWSRVVRYAALGTSILIALPSILTGLSIGLSFLATAIGGVSFGSTVMTAMAGTLGSAGAVHIGTGLGSLAISTLPHLLTCGAVLAPLALGFFMDRPHKPESHAERVMPRLNVPAQSWSERVHTSSPSGPVHAH